MTRLSIVAALCCALTSGCMSTDGDVLSTLSGDAAVDVDAAGGPDGPVAPDAFDVDADPCERPCPDPAPGEVTICGQLIDLETSQPVTASAPQVRVFDFDELRQNPTGAVQLSPDEQPDECGWFHTTIDATAGLTVVHTGNYPSSGSYRAVTTVVATLEPTQKYVMNAFVLRTVTDQAWSSDAGLLLGSFADAGAVMAIFVDLDAPAVRPFDGTPVSGVTMLADGVPHVADDYYFSDSDSVTRSTVDPGLTTSGPNGAALMRGSAVLATYTGQHASCAFNNSQGLPIPTTVQVQEIAGFCN